MDSALYSMFSSPQQQGSGLPVFSGARRHLTGGGFFGTLMRYAIPVLKSIGTRALGAASRGANQYISGSKKLAPAMLDEFGGEAMDFVQEGIKNFSSSSGKKRKRPPPPPTRTKSKRTKTSNINKTRNKTIFS